MTKLNSHQVQQAARALGYVEDIDRAIRHISSRDGETLRKYGEALRAQIGQNVFSQFVNQDVGRIAANAIRDALLKRREELINETDFVEFPSFTVNPSK